MAIGAKLACHPQGPAWLLPRMRVVNNQNKYVDDATKAASINLPKSLVPDPTSRPAPLGYNERTKMVLNPEDPEQDIFSRVERLHSMHGGAGRGWGRPAGARYTRCPPALTSPGSSTGQTASYHNCIFGLLAWFYARCFMETFTSM